jgi:hypothetical protein
MYYLLAVDDAGSVSFVTKQDFIDELSHLDFVEVKKQLPKAFTKKYKDMKTMAGDMWDLIVPTKPSPSKNRQYFNFNLARDNKVPEKDTSKLRKVMFKFTTKSNLALSSDFAMLAFVGEEGRFTPIHFDWGKAINIAFALGAYNPNKALAWWFFVHSTVYGKLLEWVKGKGHTSPITHCISVDDAMEFACMYPNHAMCVDQHAGVAIEVPPGWAHQVQNLQKCIKVACDPFDEKYVLEGVKVWRDAKAEHFTGTTSPNDYAHPLRNVYNACTSAILQSIDV